MDYCERINIALIRMNTICLEDMFALNDPNDANHERNDGDLN